MPDILTLISKWWKYIAGLVVFSVIGVALINYLIPNQYLATSTALPANSYLADKSKIFNENIAALYSTMGTADELDMIAGTGQLDTVFLSVVDQFDLANHYTMGEKGEAARAKAAILLKKYSSVRKSEYGELKVRVRDKDRALVPQLANAIMEKIQAIHTDLQGQNNRATLDALLAARKKLTGAPDTSGLQNPSDLAGQVSEYNKLIGQYELMIINKTPALLIVERARVPAYPDRFKTGQLLTGTAILSFIFGLLLALMLEKRKNYQGDSISI